MENGGGALDHTVGTIAPTIEARTVEVLGHRMRYLTAGEGEPVLLLHGLADNAESWSRILPALAQRYQVIAPDLLGCGGSDKPAIIYNLWALATYTRYFLDALGIQRAHVIGHSLGGGLALHLYIQYPERVSDLALIAPGGMGRQLSVGLRLCTLTGSSAVIGLLLASRTAQNPAARMGRAVLQRFWPATAIAATATTGAPLPGTTTAPTDAEMLFAAEEAGVLDRLRDPGARAAFLSMLRSACDIRGQRDSALSALPLVDVPVLLIHGERDATIPLSHSHAAAQVLRHASLEVLAGCGHCPQREAPDRVLHLIERFLRAPAAAVARHPRTSAASAT